jgi:hypothetical protein
MIRFANAACRTDRFPLGRVAASDRVTAISRGHANGGGGGGGGGISKEEMETRRKLGRHRAAFVESCRVYGP